MSDRGIEPVRLEAGIFTASDVDNLKKQASVVVDIYESQLEELYKLRHPTDKAKEGLAAFKQEQGSGDLKGNWVFYPWNKQLLHIVDADQLLELRTNRNKLLITADEQQKLQQAVVGIAGMSVGAGMAIAMAYTGISQTIKIADFDTLDTTNLNRLREPLAAVGSSKVELAAQHIYEIDPYAEVKQFDKGLSDKNIDEFFQQPALQVVIDEIDDFQMKVKLRLQAKQHQIPLVMFTSLGDNILVDIERYDQEPDLPIFHGLLGDLSEEILAKAEMSEADIRRYSVQLVGQEYIPTRALRSVAEMGKTLVGRPQLYSTIAVDGGLCAFVVRHLLLSQEIKSGRYFINFAKLFNVADDLKSEDRTAILETLFQKG